MSVRYRLAPQHPFPTALLDVLIAYLSLFHPPPDSFHKPVSASNIVIAGDSAGANLCLALIQLILQLRRQDGSTCMFKFFGKDVSIPLPAGVATFSAWTDLTNSLPSFTDNKEYDYFSPTSALERVPPCDIWPTTPPRGALYCDLSALCHPLVSPILAGSWAGSPPLWFSCGQEMLVDNSRFIAQRAESQGCTVLWAEYDAMPHCFPFVFDLPQTSHTFEQWASFCCAAVKAPRGLKSLGLRVNQSMEAQSIDVRSMIDLTYEEVEWRMKRKQQEMIRSYRQKQSGGFKL